MSVVIMHFVCFFFQLSQSFSVDVVVCNYYCDSRWVDIRDFVAQLCDGNIDRRECGIFPMMVLFD